MRYHISKARVLYNTLCGRLVKGVLTVSTLKQLKSYPIKNQCKRCAKVFKN